MGLAGLPPWNKGAICLPNEPIDPGIAACAVALPSTLR